MAGSNCLSRKSSHRPLPLRKPIRLRASAGLHHRRHGHWPVVDGGEIFLHFLAVALQEINEPLPILLIHRAESRVICLIPGVRFKHELPTRSGIRTRSWPRCAPSLPTVNKSQAARILDHARCRTARTTKIRMTAPMKPAIK